MPARTLMIQGTSSSVGKSLLTAGLCRIFARRGLRVAPFKAQNMSNNAAVCPDGSEIGRAQAVQAAAAGIEPTADMNPVLLKPEGQTRSQVIVMGKPWQTLSAVSLQGRKQELWTNVTSALDRLRDRFDLVVIEGAGSPVELNLAQGDIVNMAIAEYARAPVLLVGDIDRGGIFAQLLGTLWLFTAEQKKLVKGLVVNRFRGDRSLFVDGVRILEERGDVPVLGVVPYLADVQVPEEDAVALDTLPQAQRSADSLDIAIIKLPHIANFDDFDPLYREDGLNVRYVARADELGRPHAVILPGTKTTMADLAWLREQRLDRAICALAGEGAAVVGICGGYQMLGRTIRDRGQVESASTEMPGLGLLPVDTDFLQEKATYQVRARILDGPGWLASLAGVSIEGYEIHMGRTASDDEHRHAWLEVLRRRSAGFSPSSGQRAKAHTTADSFTDECSDIEPFSDGSVDEHARIWGCYLHGLFANDPFRWAWLSSLRKVTSPAVELQAQNLGRAGRSFDDSLNRLADALEQSLDMDHLERILAES